MEDFALKVSVYLSPFPPLVPESTPLSSLTWGISNSFLTSVPNSTFCPLHHILHPASPSGHMTPPLKILQKLPVPQLPIGPLPLSSLLWPHSPYCSYWNTLSLCMSLICSPSALRVLCVVCPLCHPRPQFNVAGSKKPTVRGNTPPPWSPTITSCLMFSIVTIL